MSECMQLSVAVCRIGFYTCFRALCCRGPVSSRPEYDVVCIGLTGAGKTSLLSRLCSEATDSITPTTGFSIKAVPFQNTILNVKELGGAENIKKYWSRYYQGSQGVVFILDSTSSEEDLEVARAELHSALQHPQLCTLPFLILANHQDKPAARSVQECFRALCCRGPVSSRPEYDVVCIGLTGAGKTSLLSRLCSEATDSITPTTGFSIKAVPFQNTILNVKELGGAENIKKYWSRYYQGSQGVVFILDSTSSEEDLEVARAELHSALQHPQLCTLPFLILANHQDKPAARSVQEIKKYFELEPLARGKRWILEGSTVYNMEAVKESFSQLIGLLEEKEMEPGRI